MYHDFCKSKNKKNRSLQLCLLLSVILFTINPLLAIDSLQVHWSTYIGGSEGLDFGGLTWELADNVSGMVADNSGNLYIVGTTKTTNLSGRTNYHTTQHICAFVTKLNSAGIIQWTTYVGGSPAGNAGSQGFGICVDTNGDNVFITGSTPTDADFPGHLHPDWLSGGAFVTSIRTSDGLIQWSRMLTRYTAGQGNAICVHDGYLFVTGLIGMNGELQNPKNTEMGNGDAFIYKLTTAGTVMACCFYGGSKGREYGNDIFIDNQNNIYLTGEIFWSIDETDYDLPGEKNEWRGQQCDGFVCKFDSDLNVLWSRYIGGSNYDFAYDITGDNQGNLWIAGASSSYDHEGEIIEPFNGDVFTVDGYITKINASGNKVDWTSFAGYLGGGVTCPKLLPGRKIITVSKCAASSFGLQMFDADLGYHQWFIGEGNFLPPYDPDTFKDIFVDESMNIYICGDAPYNNTNFPNRNNEHSGRGYDAFLVKTSPKGEFFNFQNDLMSPWEPISPECWSVQNGKLVFTGINQHLFRLILLNEFFYNFTYQVQARKVSGSTTYGIFFRRDPQTKDAYQFGINSEGEYFVNYWKDNNSQRIIDFTSSDAIKPGLNVWNTLKVTAEEDTLKFYANGVILNSLEGAAIMGGYMGLFGEDNQNVTNIIEFDNVYIGSYTTTPTDVEEAEIASSLTQEFGLAQNYPNPFNPTTTIKYTIPKESKVILSIYNLLGEEVITLVDIVQQSGTYTVHWNGMTEDGTLCPSGLYIYKMKAGDFAFSKKLMLIR